MFENSSSNDDGLKSRHGRRLLLALDVDDVLADFRRDFIAITRKIMDIEVTAETYTEDWRSLWKTDESTTLRIACELQSIECVSARLPVVGSQEAIADLAAAYDLVALTSRPVALLEATERWLHAHYGAVFQHVVSLGFWDNRAGPEAHAGTKGQTCRDMGVRVLIDDQLKHCLSCSRLGIPSILFGVEESDQSQPLILPAPDWPTALIRISENLEQLGF